MLLIACTWWKVWSEVPEYGRLYCYDNVWADTNLRNGDEPEGIFGWVDVFTWEGFLHAEVFHIFADVF